MNLLFFFPLPLDRLDLYFCLLLPLVSWRVRIGKLYQEEEESKCAVTSYSTLLAY